MEVLQHRDPIRRVIWALNARPGVSTAKDECSDCGFPVRPLFPCTHDVLGLRGCMHGDGCDKVHYDPAMFCRYGLIALILDLLEGHPELFDGKGTGDTRTDQGVWVAAHAKHSRMHAQGNCPGCAGNGHIVSFANTGWPRRADKPNPEILRKQLSDLAIWSMGGC